MKKNNFFYKSGIKHAFPDAVSINPGEHNVQVVGEIHYKQSIIEAEHGVQIGTVES